MPRENSIIPDNDICENEWFISLDGLKPESFPRRSATWKEKKKTEGLYAEKKQKYFITKGWFSIFFVLEWPKIKDQSFPYQFFRTKGVVQKFWGACPLGIVPSMAWPTT